MTAPAAHRSLNLPVTVGLCALGTRPDVGCGEALRVGLGFNGSLPHSCRGCAAQLTIMSFVNDSPARMMAALASAPSASISWRRLYTCKAGVGVVGKAATDGSSVQQQALTVSTRPTARQPGRQPQTGAASLMDGAQQLLQQRDQGLRLCLKSGRHDCLDPRQAASPLAALLQPEDHLLLRALRWHRPYCLDGPGHWRCHPLLLGLCSRHKVS